MEGRVSNIHMRLQHRLQEKSWSLPFLGDVVIPAIQRRSRDSVRVGGHRAELLTF